MSNTKLTFYNPNKKTTSRRYLPGELLTKILCKLPVKSIVKCTLVCREWYSFIKGQTFISFHLNYNNNNVKDSLVLLDWKSPFTEVKYSLHHLDDNNNDFNDDIELHLVPNVFCRRMGGGRNAVVASCNGLLLMAHSHVAENVSTFCFLWNPLIRKSVFLPKPFELWVRKKGLVRKELFGLGFDSVTDDYKILCIVELSVNDNGGRMRSFSFQVYSLKLGHWSSVTPYRFQHRVVVGCYDSLIAFVNGFFHYVCYEMVESSDSDSDANDIGVAEHCNFVGVFHVHSETFSRIKLPELLEDFDPHELSVWVYRDSSIAVFEHYSAAYAFSLWVMGEYGVEDSWTNLLTVDETPFPVKEVYGFAAFWKNGKLVLKAAEPGDEDAGTDIVLYDPETHQFGELCSSLNSTGVMFFSYVPTLVLLDMGNDANADKSCN